MIALTDTAKVLQRTYGFSPWGTLNGGTDVAGFARKDRARFKGALWLGPEAELYYMRNRWYEPKTGRFLSEDPIGLEGGINLYAYVGGDPINGRDPLGLCSTLFKENGHYRPGRTATVGEVLEGPEGGLFTCGCGGTWIPGVHSISAFDCIGSPGRPLEPLAYPAPTPAPTIAEGPSCGQQLGQFGVRLAADAFGVTLGKALASAGRAESSAGIALRFATTVWAVEEAARLEALPTPLRYAVHTLRGRTLLVPAQGFLPGERMLAPARLARVAGVAARVLIAYEGGIILGSAGTAIGTCWR